MPIISMLLCLITIGIVLWLINGYIPMAQPIKTILNIVVVLLVVIWLLHEFGILQHGPVLKLK